MKRKSTEQATAAANFSAILILLTFLQLISELAHISPVLLTSSKLNPSAKRIPTSLLSLNSICDDVSCNTTLESSILPLYQAASELENSCSVFAADANANAAEADSKQGDVVLTDFVNSPTLATTTVEQNVAGDSNLMFEILASVLTTEENENSSALEIFAACDDESSECKEFTDEITHLISDSRFSEKSFDDDDDSISPYFSLFKEFHQQIFKLSSDGHYEVSSLLHYDYSNDIAQWRFEDEEDDGSYRLLRSRERN